MKCGLASREGLREAVVETAASAAGDVRPKAVEGLAAVLVLVEAEVEEGAQEASALGGAEADGSFDVAVVVGERAAVAIAAAVL